MKKVRNVIPALILIAALLISPGCTSDPESLLTDRVWTFENLTTDSENENVQSIIAFAKALMSDATLEFQEGGNYILTSPLADDPSTGTWQLIGEDQLIMDPEGDEPASTGNIEVLTKDRLSYIETMTDLNMNTYTTTTTWVSEE